MAREEPRSRLDTELQRALGFGDAELVANRAGHITRRQAIRLSLRDAGMWLGFAFIVALLIGSVAYALLAPIIVLSRAGASAQNVFAVLLLELVVIGFALLFRWGATYYLTKARRSLDELRAGAVARREGTMSAVQERVEMARGYSYVHVLVAGTERYNIPFAVYRVFEDGEEYRVFFMPESKVVVAIEALDRFGQSGRLRHRHRWGHLDGQLWWPTFILISAAVLITGLALSNPPVALLGLGCSLLSGLVAVRFVRGL